VKISKENTVSAITELVQVEIIKSTKRDNIKSLAHDEQTHMIMNQQKNWTEIDSRLEIKRTALDSHGDIEYLAYKVILASTFGGTISPSSNDTQAVAFLKSGKPKWLE
jgi:hypothetical protein